MHGRDHLAECRTQNWGKRDGKRLDRGDVQSARAAGGGDLEADEPCPHDRDTRRAHQFVAEGDGVVQTPQNKQPRSWRNARGRPDVGARCDDQPVVVSECAIGKCERLARRSTDVARTPSRMSSASAS